MITSKDDPAVAASLRDVDFIDSEIIRFHHVDSVLSFEQQFGEGVLGAINLMATLPNPVTGQGVPCGREAQLRFDTISKRIIDRLERPADWSAVNLAKKLRDLYIGFAIREDFDSKEEFIFNWFQRAVTLVGRRHRAVTYYLPCQGLRIGSLEEYTFAPITYLRQNVFFTRFDKYFLKGEARLQRRMSIGRRRMSESQKQFIAKLPNTPSFTIKEEFQKASVGMPWIAEVSVPRCDLDIAADRADAALRLSLSCLKLLVPEREAGALQHGSDPRPQHRIARLSISPAKAMQVSGSARFGEPSVPESWRSEVEEHAAEQVQVAKYLVTMKLRSDPAPWIFKVAQRAVEWYSDAVSDDNPETCIIKCVTAIESVTLPNRQTARVAFVVRGALLAQREGISLENSLQLSDEIYKIRSDVAHGNIDYLGSTPALMRERTLSHTRRVVLQFLSFCSGVEPIGQKKDASKVALLDLYRSIQNSFEVSLLPKLSELNLTESFTKLKSQDK